MTKAVASRGRATKIRSVLPWIFEDGDVELHVSVPFTRVVESSSADTPGVDWVDFGEPVIRHAYRDGVELGFGERVDLYDLACEMVRLNEEAMADEARCHCDICDVGHGDRDVVVLTGVKSLPIDSVQARGRLYRSPVAL